MTDHTPTAEQADALRLFATGKSLAIEAGAGAGKTSTLMLLAQSTKRRGQYIAFNKAIVTEAGAKMPANVACSTAHSLAYRNIVSANPWMSDRLRNSRRMKSSEIADRLNIDALQLDVTIDGKPQKKNLSRGYLAGLTMRGLTRFCQSADAIPNGNHVPYVDGIDQPGSHGNNNTVAAALVRPMTVAWMDLVDAKGQLPFKHDHYLKMWADVVDMCNGGPNPPVPTCGTTPAWIKGPKFTSTVNGIPPASGNPDGLGYKRINVYDQNSGQLPTPCLNSISVLGSSCGDASRVRVQFNYATPAAPTNPQCNDSPLARCFNAIFKSYQPDPTFGSITPGASPSLWSGGSGGMDAWARAMASGPHQGIAYYCNDQQTTTDTGSQRWEMPGIKDDTDAPAGIDGYDQYAYTGAFFDRYLKQRDTDLLDGVSSQFPEVTFRRHDTP